MRIVLSLSEKDRLQGEQSPYYRALLAAGAAAGEITMVSAQDSGQVRMDQFDGILFAGGEDVDPAFYGEEKKYESVKASRTRDEFEQGLLHAALGRRLPILGICRGAQLINVDFGGDLYQDLAQDFVPEFEHQQAEAGLKRTDVTHTVTVTEPDSLLHRAVQGSCQVNSMHHQAIRHLGRGLKVSAHSEDGLVEAVESAGDYPFLLAVQWHPEEITGHDGQLRIFKEFVDRCRERGHA
ncbi:MAG TPA: gamma-glutamyl-gamma-aminobutyrate hydrolase family protein [Terriglobia bacterium]|jgi:putative glutamine amidotransferase|nr:gamma-glutamyl-gamma-aminobutyrate hydrolase family protein [Terriglobia bacterium]